MKNKDIESMIQKSLEDMKARDIYKLDISKKSTITDTMFIATGTSTRHVRAIAENLVFDAKRSDHAPLGVEGENGSEWVLVDLDAIIVHIMTEKMREFYNLEKLWETEFMKETS